MVILRSKKVLLDGEFSPARIKIEDEKIVGIAPYEGEHDIDYGELCILPGCIDLHVHINEPGRTNWEGYESGTQAAAAGGTTTIVDMPLNSIPSTINASALETKRASAKAKAYVNVGFWGGAVPGNEKDIPDLAAEKVRGFKCFMVPSGVEEFDFVSTQDLEKSAEAIQPTGLRLLAHAEDPETIEKSAKIWTGENGASYADYLLSRPEEAEEIAVQTLVRISTTYDLDVHVVHVASARALDVIRAAKAQGCKITAETCAHYLYFSAEDISDGDTLFKCAPPIRKASVREALWGGLADGTLDFITSDHSPSLPSLKGLEKETPSFARFDKAWGGISSIQFLLSVVWTSAKARGFSLSQVSDWLSKNPAEWNAFEKRGRLASGFCADLIVFDPDAFFEVGEKKIFHRHKVTPYYLEKLSGLVHATYVSGKLIFSDGDEAVDGPFGKLV